MALVAAAVVIVGAAPPAFATSITVNTALDPAPNADTGHFPTDGMCSLRAAIRSAQGNSNADDVDCATGLGGGVLDTIHIDPSLAGQTMKLTYATAAGVQPFDLISSPSNPLEIIGPTTDAADFVIDADNKVRPFDLGYVNLEAGILKLANLTITHGNAANGGFNGAIQGDGGAFYLGTNSELTLDNVFLRDNSAASRGGAIYASAPRITNNGGAYVNNSAGTLGGAIFVTEGPWRMDGFALLMQGNSANKGGAIATNPGVSSVSVHLERSLIRDNTAPTGGVLYVDSSSGGTVFELQDSTVYNNSSVLFTVANTQRFDFLRDTFVSTGEVFRGGGGHMANSIVSDSTCAFVGGGGMTGSRNLLNGGTGTCGALAGFNSLGSVTGLASLAQNGGPLVQKTFALTPGSNAIDNADQAFCGTVDARSVPRGVEGNGTLNSPQPGDCDIGAYEYAKVVVNFVASVSSANENSGTVNIPVRMRLLDPDLQTLTAPVTVGIALDPASTATIGPDPDFDDLDVAGNGVTFPAGATDGAIANLVVHIHQDNIAERFGENALIKLTSSTTPGVAIAEPKQHELSIQDDDQAGVTVSDGGNGTDVAEATPNTSDSVSVQLSSQPDRTQPDPNDPHSFGPPADVDMTVRPDRDCTVLVDGQVGTQASPVTSTILNADWNKPHAVQVFAVNDLYDEDLRDETATHICELRFTFASLDPVYQATQDAYEVRVHDNDTAGVTITPVGSTDTLAEGSATGNNYSVVLDTPPDPGKPLPGTPRGPTNVVVTPAAGCNAGNGAGVAKSYSFTDANWNVAQNLKVTATDNLKVELLHSCTVTTTINSPDPVYANLDDSPTFAHTPPTLTELVQDYAPPGITDDPPFAVVDTGGGVAVAEASPNTPDTVSVKLLRAPVGAPVTVTLDSANDPLIGGAQLALAAGGGARSGSVDLTFDASTWDTAQTVSVYAINDDFDENDVHSWPISVSMSSTAPGFNDPSLRKVVIDGAATLDSGSFNTDISDNDTSAIVLSESGGSTQVAEGGATDTIGVRLATHPYHDVTVNFTAGPECTVDGAGTKSIAIAAADWKLTASVTVAAVDDLDLQGAHPCTIDAVAVSTDGRYQNLAGSVTARVADNDLPRALVSTGDPAHVLKVAEAGATTDTFDVVLASRPSAAVTVNFAVADSQTTVPFSVTFTRAAWDVVQTVTVQAVDDQIDEPDTHSGTINLSVTSTALGYATAPETVVDGTPSSTLDIEITDDDTASLVKSVTDLVGLTEAGPDAAFGVRLGSEPATQSVEVAVSAAGLCSVAPSMLTYDATTWSDAQTVTVTPGEDHIIHAQQCTVHLAAASTDPAYAGLTADLSGPVTDDDVAGVSIAPAALTLSEATPGTPASYTVMLDTQPSADVTVDATVDSQVTLSDSQLVFTPANWDQPRAITVTVVDDTAVESSPHASSITSAVSSSDSDYDGITAATVAVAIDDNDTTTTVTAEPNPSNDGVHTTARAKVAGGVGVPTGDVQFSLNGTDVGSPVTLTAGTAELDLGALGRETYTLGAAYVGDAAHAASTDSTSLVVTAVPTAVDDAVTIDEDSGPALVAVLTNDSDADADPLSVSANAQPAHGSAACSATDCTYTPAANFNGTDTFTYTVTDGALAATATVTITVTAVDDPPVVAHAVHIDAVGGRKIRFNLLAGATGVDGRPLVLLHVTKPHHGTLRCKADGHCTYTPNAHYSGPDSFRYTIGERAAAASAMGQRAVAPQAEAAGTSTATFTAHITVVAAPSSSTPPPTHSPGSSTPPPTDSAGSSTPPTHSAGSSTPPTNSPNTSTASHNPSHNPEGGGSEVSQTGSDIRAAVLTGSLILLCGAFLVALGLIRRRAKQH